MAARQLFDETTSEDEVVYLHSIISFEYIPGCQQAVLQHSTIHIRSLILSYTRILRSHSDARIEISLSIPYCISYFAELSEDINNLSGYPMIIRVNCTDEVTVTDVVYRKYRIYRGVSSEHIII